MWNTPPRLLLPTAVISLLCFAFSANTQAAPVSQVAAADSAAPQAVNASENEESRPTRQRVEELLRSVQNAQQLDETTKAELLKRYKAALDWITASEDALKKTAQYQAEIAGVAESVEKVKSQLAAPLPDPSATFPAETTLREMEQTLSRLEAQFREFDSELTKREEELKHRGERKAELAKLTDDTRQRLDAAKKQLVSPPANGESAELATARRVELAAYAAAMEQQLERYRVEVQRHDALVEVLPLQRDLTRRERNLREKQVAAAQLAVAAKRKAESERQARETQREVAMSHPALRELAERNAALAEKLKTLSESITKTTDEVSATDKTLAQLEADFKNTQEKVRYAGNSSSIGLVLRTKRNELPETETCEQRIRFVGRMMPEANLTRMELQEERATLADLDTAARDAVAGLDLTYAAAHGRQHLEETRELLEKKRDLLDKLINGYDQYLTKLSELEIGNSKLISKSEEVAAYVDERVLWVRSADVLCPSSAADAAKGLLRMTQPEQWIDLSKQCGLDAIRKPGVIIFMAAVFGILIAVQTRMGNRMKSVCAAASGGAMLKIWPDARRPAAGGDHVRAVAVVAYNRRLVDGPHRCCF